ncbi:MAG: response regulator [Armatimonadota bacterium]
MPPPHVATVLIVEDDGTTRLVLRHIVAAAGCVAETAADGVEALEWLSSHSPPQLILLDLVLPRLGGEQMLRRIARQPPLSRVPVVVLTGGAQGAAVATHPQVRAVLSKPFVPEQIRTIIQELTKDYG